MTIVAVNGKAAGYHSTVVVSALRGGFANGALSMDITVTHPRGDQASSVCESSVSSRASLLDRHENATRRSRCGSTMGSEAGESIASEALPTEQGLWTVFVDCVPTSWPHTLICDTDACHRGWSDRNHELEGLPSPLLYSYLVKAPYRGLDGTHISLVFEKKAVLYLFYANDKTRSGGLEVLAESDEWEEVPTGMTWSGKEVDKAVTQGLALLKREVCEEDSVELPGLHANATMGFFVSPVDEDGVPVSPVRLDVTSPQGLNLRSLTVPPPKEKHRLLRSSTLPKKKSTSSPAEG